MKLKRYYIISKKRQRIRGKGIIIIIILIIVAILTNSNNNKKGYQSFGLNSKKLLIKYLAGKFFVACNEFGQNASKNDDK